MCIRDRVTEAHHERPGYEARDRSLADTLEAHADLPRDLEPVSYTHLRAHETVLDLVCRLLLEKQK